MGLSLDCRRRDGAVELGAEEFGHHPRRVLADDGREHGPLLLEQLLVLLANFIREVSAVPS